MRAERRGSILWFSILLLRRSGGSFAVGGDEMRAGGGSDRRESWYGMRELRRKGRGLRRWVAVYAVLGMWWGMQLHIHPLRLGGEVEGCQTTGLWALITVRRLCVQICTQDIKTLRSTLHNLWHRPFHRPNHIHHLDPLPSHPPFYTHLPSLALKPHIFKRSHVSHSVCSHPDAFLIVTSLNLTPPLPQYTSYSPSCYQPLGCVS